MSRARSLVWWRRRRPSVNDARSRLLSRVQSHLLALAVVCAAPGVALGDCYVNPNGQPNLGRVGCESCGSEWVPIGTCRSPVRPGYGPHDGDWYSFRKNAIWNSLTLNGQRTTPADPAGLSEFGGMASWEAFTTPQGNGLDMAVRLGAAAGYTAQQNILLDGMMGLGPGFGLGPFSLMVLLDGGFDMSAEGNDKTMRLPTGIYGGPEAHAQLWITSSAAIDVTAHRLFRLSTGTPAAGKDVDAETRLAGALRFVSEGHGVGLLLGVAYVDYGIGSRISGSLGLCWGAR
jgi:hypothetical protein